MFITPQRVQCHSTKPPTSISNSRVADAYHDLDDTTISVYALVLLPRLAMSVWPTNAVQCVKTNDRRLLRYLPSRSPDTCVWCVVGGGVQAAAFTLTLFAGGGFHATAAIRVEPLVGGGSLVGPTGQRLRVD